MQAENTMRVGDTVRVDFYGAQTTLAHRAELVGMPRATGDSWIFLDLSTAALHYVSEGCTVTLLQRNPST